MIAPARMQLARGAAVSLHGADDALLGHGLLLELPGGETVALTCHHVIARVDPSTVKLHAAGDDVLAVTLDEAASRPRNDVAVLRPVQPPAMSNPLLHVPDPESFAGALPAVGLIPGEQAGTINAMLVPSGRVRVPVPYEPKMYVLPTTFALKAPSDTKEGISGAPVIVEGGVVGLVHFARSTTPKREREAYVNPLTAWLPGLPELSQVIEPFVGMRMRELAAVHSGRTLRPERDGLKIEQYRPNVYLAREADGAARQAVDRFGAVCIVGTAGSGKSRLACELLRERPDAVVILPEPLDPPDDIGDPSGLAGREVVLLFENIHIGAEQWKTVQWKSRLQRIAGRTVVMATARVEKDGWTAVQAAQRGLLETLNAQPVFLSPPGEELSDDQGRQLAGLLGLDDDEFRRRWQHTPGSLLHERDQAPPAEDAALPEGEQAGIAIEESHHAVPNNLPLLSSTFIGRDRELADIDALLDGNRLVTLVGPVGRGKTRLAGRTAHRRADRYPQGAWWVDLVAVTDPAFVPHAVGLVLGAGVGTSRTREDAIADRLAGGPALVVLNGYQHVAAATGALASTLLGRAPDLTILATGLVPLQEPLERAYEVPPLAGPTGEADAPSAAERLFFERAGGAVHEADRAPVARLCRDLANNPLAIEIAAARARGAGVDQVIADLGRYTQGSETRGASEAVGDAIAQTLDGLDEAGRTVFGCLAVFAGWWTLPAAVAVVTPDVDADRVPDLLRALVDHALVLMDKRDQRGNRFLLLEGVREHSLRHLEASGNADAVRLRHARHYLELATQAKRHIGGAAASEWQDHVLRDRDNLRAALRWSIDANELEIAFGLGAALWPIWQRTSQFANGRRWLDRLIAVVPDDLSGRPRGLSENVAEVYNGAGNLSYDACDYAAAETHHGRCLELRRAIAAEHLVAGSLNNLGLIARRRGDLEGAQSLFASAIELSRRHENAGWVALHLNNLANALRENGDDVDRAIALQHESFALFSRLGSEWGAAMALCDLGWAIADGGRMADARRHLLTSLEMRRRLEDRSGEGQSLNGVARLDRLEGRPWAAADRHRVAIRVFDELGDRVRTAESMEGEALAQFDMGQVDDAAALLAAAQSIRDEIGAPLPPAGRQEVEDTRAKLPPVEQPALRELLQRIEAPRTSGEW